MLYVIELEFLSFSLSLVSDVYPQTNLILHIADKKAGKFKEWLKIGSYSELKPTQEVVEVLSYLAYDTVREVNL